MKINSKRLTEIFLDLISISAVSKEEKPVAGYIKNFLAELGINSIEDNAGKIVGGNTGNIIAKLNGSAGTEPIAFAAHMDTVKPTAGINPHIEDGRIVSDGSTILGADNRAGIAIILYTIETIVKEALPAAGFEAVFTIGEETGLFGSTNLDKSKVSSKTAYILDSSSDPGCYVFSAPGALEFDINLYGKSSHAAVHPEDGINALSMAAELINNFPLGQVDENTTINFGRINGGEANNVIPPQVDISGEIRSFSDADIQKHSRNLRDILDQISKKFGGRYEYRSKLSFPGFILDLNSGPVRRLNDCLSECGLTPKPIKYLGGSDANILNGRGMTAVNLGIGAKNPHSTDEYILIKDLEKMADVVLNLIKIGEEISEKY